METNIKGMSPLKIGFMKLKKNKLAMFGIFVLIIFIATSIFAPVITPYGRDEIDLMNTFAKPSGTHWLGTDDVGRDNFTRLIYAGRVSLSVGLVSTSIAACIGILLGAVSGFYGGKVDFMIMRVVDIFMCFPFFVIAITIAAVLGPSIWNVMIISGVLGWTSIARMVRAEVISLKEREFIEASKALGLSSTNLIFRHIIPNIVGTIIVYTTLGIASGILSEAGLSFLGLGVELPVPSWGNMLSTAQSLRSLRMHWWLWIPPGMCVFLTILSINFVGDGLRDALDPKTKL